MRTAVRDFTACAEGGDGHSDNMLSHHLPLALVLVTAAGLAQVPAREPTYQGRTLMAWLNEAGLLADQPLMMLHLAANKEQAIRALGPGAKQERQAFDWLASQVAHSPEALAAWHKKEIDLWWPLIKAAGIKVE